MLHRDDQKGWHHCHLVASKEEREAGLREEYTKEKTGVVPTHRFKLLRMALNYRTCKPLNPRFTKLGWYDKLIDERQEIGEDLVGAGEIDMVCVFVGDTCAFFSDERDLFREWKQAMSQKRVWK